MKCPICSNVLTCINQESYLCVVCNIYIYIKIEGRNNTDSEILR